MVTEPLRIVHKVGDPADAHNWRPIAILAASYKILARMLYERLRGVLDAQQADEQFGFRASRITTNSALIVEHIISKTLHGTHSVGL